MFLICSARAAEGEHPRWSNRETGGGQIELMVTRQMCFLFSDGFFFAHDISRLTQTSSRYRYASFTQSSGCVLYHPKRLALARAIIHQVVNRNCGKANPAPCFSCGTVSEAMIR